MLEKLTKLSLLAAFAIPPFIVAESLYFPFVSGKVYIFRLLVGISFALWIFLILGQPRRYAIPFKNPLVIATLLFFAALLLTAFLGVDPIHSLFSNIERADGVLQFGYWVLYFLMLASVFKTKKDWKIFFGVFVAVLATIAAGAWIDYTPRLAGAFNNPSYLGGLMLFAIGATALLWNLLTGRRPQNSQPQYLGSSKKQKKSRHRENSQNNQRQTLISIAAFVLLLFFFITIIFTQTRGDYLGFAAGFTIFVVLSWFWQRKRYPKLVKTASVLFLAGAVSFVILASLVNSPLVRSNPILGRIAGIPSAISSAAGAERILAWQSALEAFKVRPVFGWGPENFDVAFNRFYDYNAARVESWFDSSHNQPLDVLSEGGLALLLFYLLWIGSVLYVSRRLIKRGEPFIGITIVATYAAFIVQGLVLFDTFFSYAGLFPLLGFLTFRYEAKIGAAKQAIETNKNAMEERINPFTRYVIGSIGVLGIIAWLYFSAWLPYRSNLFATKAFGSIKAQQFGDAKIYLDEAIRHQTPFTFFDIRNFTIARLVELLDTATVGRDTPGLDDFYSYLTPRIEEAMAYRPLDPQIYYFGGRLYKLGGQYLGRGDDLPKAENTLRKGRTLSTERVEYVNELAEVLIIDGRFNEAEAIVLEQLRQVPPPLSSVIAGHLYFVGEKYDLAADEYEKARKEGYEFWRKDGDYGRYLVANEELNHYDRILSMSLEFLEHRGPDPLAWFNVAVAYKNMGQEKEATAAYREAIKLDPQYRQYQQFFPEI